MRVDKVPVLALVAMAAIDYIAFSMSVFDSIDPIALRSALVTLTLIGLGWYLFTRHDNEAPKRPLRPSQRLALSRRRVGGIHLNSGDRLTIDAAGIFETRLGLIPWSEIVGLRKVVAEIEGASIPMLQLCVRGPWRYLPAGNALQRFGTGVPRDARYGTIRIATSPYRVDLDVAHTIALSLRRDCAAPFVEDWRHDMREGEIEMGLHHWEVESLRRQGAQPYVPLGSPQLAPAPLAIASSDDSPHEDSSSSQPSPPARPDVTVGSDGSSLI